MGSELLSSSTQVAPVSGCTVDRLTLEHLKGLVGQFGTDRAAHVAILLALVLMEHTDDTAVQFLGQRHQLFHDECRLHSIVDVGHEILDAVDDADVRLDGADGHIHYLPPSLEAEAAKVEGVEGVVDRIGLGQRDDTFFQELLRRLLALLGVGPEHLQG